MNLRIASLAGVAALAGAASATQYTFQQLRLAGQTSSMSSSAADVSDSGWVVGLATLPGRNGYYQWRWKDGVFEILPELAATLGGRAEGVNESGQACGYQSNGFRSFPVKWTNGLVERLADGPGMNGGYAFDINESGDCVGTAWPHQDETHAFRWRGGAPEDLGDLPGGPHNAWGRAINDSGVCVGYAQPDADKSHAALFDPPTVTDLGVLDPTQWSDANDINAAGEMCGAAAVGLGSDWRWLHWTSAGMRDLTLAGAVDGRAESLNDLGHLAGRWFTGPSGQRVGTPYLWSERTGWRDLRPYFAGTWADRFPLAVNNKGWIVGEGRFSIGGGQYRFSAWLLRPVATVVPPDALSVVYGQKTAGSAASLAAEDADALRVCRFLVPNQLVAPVTFQLEASLPFDPMCLWLETRARALVAGQYEQSLELSPWDSEAPGQTVSAPLTAAWSKLELVAKGDVSRFCRAGDRRVRATVRVRHVGPTAAYAFCSEHDLAVFHAVSY